MVMKETKKEEPRTSRVQVNTREKPITTKATHQNKTMGEKKPVEDMSTDEEEDETMNIEEDVEVMEAKLSYKIDLIHGHLKSSNVLLDPNFEPLLTDYALVPVVNRDQSQQFMVAYKAPEFTQQDRTSRRSDVWSLGILILEILTGKFPANYLRQGKGADDELAAWVESVARTEWTADVFDKEMKAGKEHEAQMLKLLKIGLRCCDWDIEKRIELHEAVDRIEEVDRDAGGGQESVRSSYVTASDGDHRSSRAMTEEFSLM